MKDARESRICALEQTVVGLRRELRLIRGAALALVVGITGLALGSAAWRPRGQDLVEAREFRVIGTDDKVVATLKGGDHGGEIRLYGPEREALRLGAASDGGAIQVFGEAGGRVAQVLSRESRGVLRLCDENEKLRVVHQVTGSSAEMMVFDNLERCQLRLAATENTGRIDVYGGAVPKPQVVVDTTSAGPRVLVFGGAVGVADTKDGHVLCSLARDEQGGEVSVRSVLGAEQARLASGPRGGLLMLQNRAGKRKRVLRVD